MIDVFNMFYLNVNWYIMVEKYFWIFPYFVFVILILLFLCLVDLSEIQEIQKWTLHSISHKLHTTRGSWCRPVIRLLCVEGSDASDVSCIYCCWFILNESEIYVPGRIECLCLCSVLQQELSTVLSRSIIVKYKYYGFLILHKYLIWKNLCSVLSVCQDVKSFNRYNLRDSKSKTWFSESGFLWNNWDIN